jgi:hypothetical protein
MLGNIKITNSPLQIINLVIYSINWSGSKWEIIGSLGTFNSLKPKEFQSSRNHQHKVVDSHT